MKTFWMIVRIVFKITTIVMGSLYILASFFETGFVKGNGALQTGLLFVILYTMIDNED